MFKSKLSRLVVALVCVAPMSLSASIPNSVNELAIKTCSHVIKLDYKSILPSSNEDAQYTLNHYIKRFEAISQSQLDGAIDSMKNIDCKKDIVVQDLGLSNYQVNIRATRSQYIIQTNGIKTIISNFK